MYDQDLFLEQLGHLLLLVQTQVQGAGISRLFCFLSMLGYSYVFLLQFLVLCASSKYLIRITPYAVNSRLLCVEFFTRLNYFKRFCFLLGLSELGLLLLSAVESFTWTLLNEMLCGALYFCSHILMYLLYSDIS